MIVSPPKGDGFAQQVEFDFAFMCSLLDHFQESLTIPTFLRRSQVKHSPQYLLDSLGANHPALGGRPHLPSEHSQPSQSLYHDNLAPTWPCRGLPTTPVTCPKYGPPTSRFGPP